MSSTAAARAAITGSTAAAVPVLLPLPSRRRCLPHRCRREVGRRLLLFRCCSRRSRCRHGDPVFSSGWWWRRCLRSCCRRGSSTAASTTVHTHVTEALSCLPLLWLLALLLAVGGAAAVVVVVIGCGSRPPHFLPPRRNRFR